MKKPPAYLAYSFAWNALDWVFPPRCGGCNTPGERWCASCQHKTVPIGESVCTHCGLPALPGRTGLCAECLHQPPFFNAMRSWCIYQGPAREAIHRLKYGRDVGLGDVLARYLIQLASTLPWQIDLVTCVPLSPKRLKQRGYNQASLLARPVALALRAPYRAGLLARNRDTLSQVDLSAQERRKNVAGAFSPAESIPRGASIIVIDDVTTTGSTINACAKALLNAGASAVYGLTFARAVLSLPLTGSINPIL